MTVNRVPAVIHPFDQDLIDLDGKSVLVTGGTGSFGKAFIRAAIARWKPARLIVYSRDELKQSEMAAEINPADTPCIRYFIGDVRDRNRLSLAMRGIDYVVHAAAMKQVPAAEYNPMECINTNVIGAENVVQAAITNNVRLVLALSTDKAVNPANLYGASKLAADKIFIAANHLSGQNGPRFSVVRYGNVVGSRGSVVPLFRRLIAGGADSLPITDPRMTRFWITLPQGVNFVLSSMKMMRGGEIFVPKIPSMSMTDLASVMGAGMPQRIVGIRPGEKLHEALISRDDARLTRELTDRYIVLPAIRGWSVGDPTFPGDRPVDEEFAYASDTNQEWLDADGLGRLLTLAQA